MNWYRLIELTLILVGGFCIGASNALWAALVLVLAIIVWSVLDVRPTK